MNCIYLGLMFDPDGIRQAEKNSKSRLQMATHRFQEMLVEGMEQKNDVKLSVINVFPIGSYPLNYKKLVIKALNWGETNRRIGYLNVPFLKHFFQKRALVNAIRSRIVCGDDNAIVLYTLYKPFIDAAFEIKKHNKNIKVFVIQTDAVAGRCGDGKGKYDSKYKTKETDIMLKRCEEADGFILLTKHLIEPMEVGDRPYIIMEGLCDTEQRECYKKDESNNIFLYTGTVNDEYSICEMVDAFVGLPDAELWICGRGDAEDYVIEKGEKHANIKFFGFKSGKELDEIKDSCDFFINPRKPTGTYTMFSFPSKTMEYLVSGKPSIVYKLEGIPDEYDDYLNYLDIDVDMKEQIKGIIMNDYRTYRDRALKGREFVLKEKNAKIQANRVLELVSTGGITK